MIIAFSLLTLQFIFFRNKEHDTVTPVFWVVVVSASDRCKSDIKLRFMEENQ